MNKKKKSTNTSPYPDEVIDRLARAFYPAILACWNSEEGQRSLVGARPLHLANARPFGRSKAPLGLLLLRKREFALAGRAGSSHYQQKKQSVPDCWVSVKQFSKNDTATACQDWLRSTRLGRGSIKSHVRTVKVLGIPFSPCSAERSMPRPITTRRNIFSISRWACRSICSGRP